MRLPPSPAPRLAATALAAVVCLSAGAAFGQDQAAPKQGDPAAAASADPVGDLVGAAEASAPAPSTAPVRLPSPVMTAGSTLRLSLVSTDEMRRGGQDVTKTNRQAIELQVLPRKGKTRVLRYVIRSGELDNDPLGLAMLNASKDLATDFEADAAGRPLRLVDWDGVRAAMLKRLITDQSAPVDGVKRVQELLGGMDAVSAIPFAIPEVLMMSDMQGWPPTEPGRHDEAATTAGAGPGQARLTAFREVGEIDKAACTVRLTRSTALDPASPAVQGGKVAQTLQTVADVSTVDGWVIRLTQTRSQTTPAGSEVRTWTLTREDAPGCKG